MIVITDPAIIERYKAIEKSLQIAYEEKEKLLRAIQTKYATESEIKVCSMNEDGSWNRLTVVDNIVALNEGFWQPVKVNRYSTKLESLKNKPKELVEAEVSL
ncbi:MAG: hypothetical protein PHX51_07260 [Clostridia bacterium]|nr:hypothetical protein [Clostridia bacterium]